jgi:hypothetical protein
MKISYIVRDARRYQVGPAWAADRVDIPYYRGLMEKAWKEIAYALTWDKTGGEPGWEAQKELSGIPVP